MKYIAAEAWTSIGCAALKSNKSSLVPPLFCGKNPPLEDTAQIPNPDETTAVWFVLFRENDKHRNMYEGMNQLQCIETTFRSGD